MPSVSGYSSTTNSIQWIIEGLMYPAYQYSNFQIELWRGNTYIETMNWDSNSSQTYTMQTSYGLSSDTTYRAKAWTRYLNGASTYIGESSYRTDSVYIPPSYPVGYVSNVSAWASTTTNGRLYVSWYGATNATSYGVEVYWNGSFITSQSVTGTSADFSGLTIGRTYEVKVFGRRSGESNGGAGYSNYVYLGDVESYPVGYVQSVTAIAHSSIEGRLTIAWWSATNATHYGVEVKYNGSIQDYEPNVYSNEITFTGIPVGRTYTIKVYGKRAGESNGTANESTAVYMPDRTKPTISFGGMSGLGSLQLSWSAYDSGSGLRDNSRFRLYVGTRDGGSGTLSGSTYTNSTSHSWTTDANGYGLVANSYYWVGVRAYDRDNNESDLLSRQIQYRITRPSNWSWFTSKIQGQSMNLTASEWNSFTQRINLFRVYSGYSNYSFTTAVRGGVITASIINEAILAMNIIPKGISSPAQVSRGGSVTASFFNALTTSLNSVS